MKRSIHWIVALLALVALAQSFGTYRTDAELVTEIPRVEIVDRTDYINHCADLALFGGQGQLVFTVPDDARLLIDQATMFGGGLDDGVTIEVGMTTTVHGAAATHYVGKVTNPLSAFGRDGQGFAVSADPGTGVTATITSRLPAGSSFDVDLSLCISGRLMSPGDRR